MGTQDNYSVRSQQTGKSRLEDLVAAVNQLSHDDYQQFLQRLHKTAPTDPAERQSHNLTKRESEVLTLVASGYSRREIGLALSISENTAACHISSIYRKLEISTIAEATRIAINFGAI